MARQLKHRLKVSGTLTAQTPIHVGGLEAAADVDLTLAVNGKGKYYIPGTSLAGALRGQLQTDDSVSNLLWGYQERDDNSRSNQGHASFVVVEDAPISLQYSEIRDGVGIDRYAGCAAETIKFNRAILPKGTEIPLSLTFEQANSDSDTWREAKYLFADTLYALEQSAIRLGAAKTRGLGKVQLKQLKITEQNLDTFNGMIDTLLGEDKEISPSSMVPEGRARRLPKQLEIEVKWAPVGPVMVKAESEGIAVDMLPLVSRKGSGEGLSFVIPGSSVKGVMRSQAERIIRTLLSQPIAESSDPKQRFLDQLGNLPIVSELFGERAKKQTSESEGIPGRQGALEVDDCYARRSIAPTDWAAVESAGELEDLQKSLEANNLSGIQQAFHVGIDRWTGGAAKNYLYSTLELIDIDWEPICLTLNLSRDLHDEKSILALLLLLLRDMAQSRIPLGYGTNRGMGAIEVTSVTCNGRCLDDDWSSLTASSLLTEDGEFRRSDFLNELNQHWSEWIQSRRVAA
ncbi:MAG: RAMP superfamily CRISPR-associated protein [Cyanobacteria bacterium J06627_28]